MKVVAGSLAIVLLCVISFLAQGQERTVLSMSFENASFNKFVSAIEANTDYKFFYDTSVLDSVVVNGSFTNKSVHEILSSAFDKTEIRFAIDDQKNVFIVRGFNIQVLPENFFSNNHLNDNAKPVPLLRNVHEELPSKNGTQTLEVGSKMVGKTHDAAITGFIRNVENGESIPGASLYISALSKGVHTNEFGQYNLNVPIGTYDVSVTAMGMSKVIRKVVIHGSGSLNFELKEEVTSLKEVVIESDRNMNVAGSQMGFERLDIKAMKQVLAVMGEVDVFRVALTLPGVQSAGEGTTGLNVRGGAADQNLILFNDAVVFSPSHLFGFFSAFNPDVVRRVELLKSAVPVSLGGRLASVIDISSREGNSKKFSGAGGIGLLTTRLTLEGPLGDKTSFVAAGRSTYSNWLLKQIPDDDLKKSKASFYDLNLALSHHFSERNSLYFSMYASDDGFKFKDDTLYHYTNMAGSLKWKHIFSNKLDGIINLSHSEYKYSMTGSGQPQNAFLFQNEISQSDLKGSFNLMKFNRHDLNFGLQETYYSISPGTMRPKGNISLIAMDKVQKENALETALFLADDFEVSKHLSIYGGVRYSFFSSYGPADVYHYIEGLPKSKDNITDTVSFARGQPNSSYHGPEIRLSFKYMINDKLSVKGSFNRMRQYIQTLSNTTSISPTDVWKLSNTHIKPQIGDQISLGIYKNFRSGLIETSLEGYYKNLTNGLDYKDGAEFVLNHTLEADVVNVSGRAYGIELMLKKISGKLNGWINYTFSRSFLKSQTAYTSEVINSGRFYPSNFDKPHAINLIGNYKFSHRLNISLNGIYSTGRPITLPIAKYNAGTTSNILYSMRNEYRVPDYFRCDISLNMEGNHKIRKLAHSSWTIGVYNITGRRNVYSVYFRTEGQDIRGYQMSIFGTPIPTITYNFKF